MQVTIEASGSLRPDIPAGTALEQVATVGEAIERLCLSRNTGLVMLVNGRLAHWDTALRNGDVVQLLPAIGGG